MIEVEGIDVWGFEHALGGMRNSYNSWDKSDSFCCVTPKVTETCHNCMFGENTDEEHDADEEDAVCIQQCAYRYGFIIGKNDLKLMRKLIKAGSSHRKFLRQIFVSMSITAPLYWWKQFDTYKIGITTNSCSTMHAIHEKEFTREDFSCEYLTINEGIDFIIQELNLYRETFIKTKNKEDWYAMIQLLPLSYNQKRTVTMNYENVLNIIEQRSNHKLNEWKTFITELKNMPYVNELFIGKEKGEKTMHEVEK